MKLFITPTQGTNHSLWQLFLFTKFIHILETQENFVCIIYSFSQAKYYELCGHLDKANEIYSMLVVAFTNSSAAGNLTFTPPLVEKMKIELAIQDWEQADDTANRVSTVSLISKSCYNDVLLIAIINKF